MTRASASMGRKPARKVPRRARTKTDGKLAAEAQNKVFREKARVHQKDREVSTAVPLKRKFSGGEKHVRALNKKLRELEALQQRADTGDPLDEQQRQKLATLGDVLEELEGMVGIERRAGPSGR
ncbi:hypothetical protein T492DRAFT_915641 [Pavlovales sp. CCMP2436]|nr:hypothetical protein T492DRAFT_915641 [Pavlovales sp. CCMP2436]|mmetsp:Transcript_24837/g.62868  ORF Transcript_24837/g.62868 Transcript_24837/m.62868 type:complete len:124 (+) Transcript_24837:89-460(+)